MKKIFIFLSISFFALFSAGVASAQDFTSSISPENNVTVEFSPTAPKPNALVNAVASSYSIDLNSANIIWSIGGKKQVSGIGLVAFSFFVGNLGQTTTLDVLINSRNGQVIQKTFNITPSAVDLIWQADSYTPAFYQGKSLFSHEEKLKFVAIPHILGTNGKEIPASGLIYKWTKNGTVLGDFSGYGKNTYTMIGSIISVPIDMQVEVTTIDGDSLASAETTVTPVNPQIVFYKRDPLYGIQFQDSIPSNLKLTGKEINILAAPFYFANDDVYSGNLQYDWKINGQTINDGLKTERIFRSVTDTTGTSNIFLSVSNISKILQTDDHGFSLNFNSSGQ